MLCCAVLSRPVMSSSLRPHGLQPTRLLCPWDSPGKNTAVGCHALLQGIFPTEGLNPGLLHCRWILYQLSYEGRPRILEWVAYPFSRGSSHLRNWTRVSCIAGGFFTNWAIRESPVTFPLFTCRIHTCNFCITAIFFSNINIGLHWTELITSSIIIGK